MIYYRIALRAQQRTAWHWKSDIFTSLHNVLGMLNLYRSSPKEHIRVMLSTSPEHMEAMLTRANAGQLSTAITIDQLWNKQAVSWLEIWRLEEELGTGADHDEPYTWNEPPAGAHKLAWTRLLVRRELGELAS